MRAPAFWTQPVGPVALALWPASKIYGLAAQARFALSRPQRAAVPVVCVGNLVTGGQGKTPTALCLGRLLRDEGLRPGFLTRGYSARLAGPVVVDSARHTAAEVGDEALLLARCATTVVSRRRPDGAAHLVGHRVDAIVMDDGFQNPSLEKDLSLIVVDAGFGEGNGAVLPAGPLRAPLDWQLRHAHALVLVGNGAAADSLRREAERRSLPVFAARLRPAEITALVGRRVLGYAGIGRPEKFFDTLRALGAEVVETRAFADHHVFTPAEAEGLIARAERLDALLVTTEKDLARLAGTGSPLAAHSTALPVDLVFEDGERLRALVLGAVREAQRAGLPAS